MCQISIMRGSKYMNVAWKKVSEQPKNLEEVKRAIALIASKVNKGAGPLNGGRETGGLVVIDIYDGVASDLDVLAKEGISLRLWEGR